MVLLRGPVNSGLTLLEPGEHWPVVEVMALCQDLTIKAH